MNQHVKETSSPNNHYMNLLRLSLFTSLLLILSTSYAQVLICNSNSTQQLADIHFFDQMEGVAVGDSGTILRSVNGGLDWTQVPSPVQTPLKKVAFFNDSLGLAIGKRLLRTTDRGRSWIAIDSAKPFQGEYTDIEMTPNGDILITASDIPLIKSTDLGVNWDTLHDANSEVGLRLLSFVDDTLGYATIWASAINTRIQKTLDGGETWTNFTIQSGTENTVLEIFDFHSRDTGYIGGWYNGYLAKTTNAGVDWKFSTVDDTARGPQLNDIAYASENTFYVCGWHNTILRSTDQGVNWYSIHPNLPESQSFKGMFFLNDTLGWIVGTQGTIIKLNTSNTTVAIDDAISPDIDVTIFPNPTTADIHIDLPEGTVLEEVIVLGIEGKRVAGFSETEAVHITKPGRYWLRIKTNKGVVSRAVVVE